MAWRNTLLWVLQWLFGVYFVAIGIMHFIVPDGLPALMEWMYELSDTMHIIIGIAEILGGLGLILPSLTRIRPQLTVYAAAGLVLVMAGAIVFHAARGEGVSIGNNLFFAAVLVFIGYGRWKLEPIAPRE
ncbi:MAG: DoxX family protein [Acidimicrobiia bacterium]